MNLRIQKRDRTYISSAKPFKKKLAASFSLGSDIDNRILELAIGEKRELTLIFCEPSSRLSSITMNHLRQLPINLSPVFDPDDIGEQLSGEQFHVLLSGIFLNILCWEDYQEKRIYEHFMNLVLGLSGWNEKHGDELKGVILEILKTSVRHLFPALELVAALNQLVPEDHQKLIRTAFENLRHLCKDILRDEATWQYIFSTKSASLVNLASDAFGGQVVAVSEACRILITMAGAFAAAGSDLDYFKSCAQPIKKSLTAVLKGGEHPIAANSLILREFGIEMQACIKAAQISKFPDDWIIRKLLFLLDLQVGCFLTDSVLFFAGLSLLSQLSISDDFSYVDTFMADAVKTFNSAVPPSLKAWQSLRHQQIPKTAKSKEKQGDPRFLQMESSDNDTRVVVSYLVHCIEDLQADSKEKRGLVRARSDELLQSTVEVSKLVEVFRKCVDVFNVELLYCVSRFAEKKLLEIETIALQNREDKEEPFDTQALSPLIGIFQTLRFMLRQRMIVLSRTPWL